MNQFHPGSAAIAKGTGKYERAGLYEPSPGYV
jgi:hypothetical protein